MKKLFMVLPLVFLLCFTFGCQQSEEVAEETKEVPTSGTINVDGFELSYEMQGSGIPCVIAADSGLQQKVLSQELRKEFKFIFLKSRNDISHESKDVFDKFTLDTFVDDIEKLRMALGFERICVLGHSIVGIIALEYARKYPEHTSHVIMIGTPPGWNLEISKKGDEYWETHASEERKMILKRNQEQLGEEDMSSLSPLEAERKWYIAFIPKYFYDLGIDYSHLFDYYWNVEGWHHFLNVIMGNYDITQGNQITTPIFLALGLHDYIVPYVLWDDVKDSFPNLSYHLFETSGHFPMYEEQELFDKSLIDWVKSH